VAEALGRMDKMTQLDLSFNYMGAEGAAAVAGALRRMDKMTQLHLSNSALAESEAFAPMLPALAAMPALLRLHVDDWDACFSPDMKARIVAAAPAADIKWP